MKKTRISKQFLDEIRINPNVSAVCKKLNISRNTIYNWKQEDKIFCLEMDLAISDGEDHINDFAESRLIEKIKDGNLKAITFRLEKCSSKYSKHKLDDIVMANAREEEYKKNFELWEKAKSEVRLEKIESIGKEKIIVSQRTLEKMIERGSIDWLEYNDNLEFMKKMEANGITSENQAEILLERMEPTTKEILEKYKKIKEEITNKVFKKKEIDEYDL